MAVAIILGGAIAFIIAGMTSFVVMPIMYNLVNNNQLWNGVSGDAITHRDELYAIAQYFPFVGAAVVIYWMFNSAGRRSTLESGY